MDLDSDTGDARPGDGADGGAGAADARQSDEMPPVGQLLRTALDAATWGAVLLVGAAALLALVGLVVGNGLVGFKRGLFVLGFLAMGGSLLALRPRRAWKRGRDAEAPGPPTDAPDGSTEERDATDGASGPPSLLPGSLAPDPSHRASWALRAFACGIWALAVSYLMETAFGVVPV